MLHVSMQIYDIPILQMDEKLKDITDLKDKELALRDEKLNRLKKQMADALKGNSW